MDGRIVLIAGANGGIGFVTGHTNRWEYPPAATAPTYRTLISCSGTGVPDGKYQCQEPKRPSNCKQYGPKQSKESG